MHAHACTCITFSLLIHSLTDSLSSVCACLMCISCLWGKVQPERENGKKEIKPQSENPGIWAHLLTLWTCCYYVWVFLFFCYTLRTHHSLIQCMREKDPLTLSTDACVSFLRKLWYEWIYPPPILSLPLEAEKNILKSWGKHQLPQGQLSWPWEYPSSNKRELVDRFLSFLAL